MYADQVTLLDIADGLEAKAKHIRELAGTAPSVETLKPHVADILRLAQKTIPDLAIVAHLEEDDER